MTIKTQHTEVFVKLIDSDVSIFRFVCPTAVTGLGSGTIDQIDNTCLDSFIKTVELGLSDAGELTVPFIWTPDDASHRSALRVLESRVETQVCIALSDGTAAPTLVSQLMAAPVNRTSFIFPAFVMQIAFDAPGNEIIRGTMLFKINGFGMLTYADGVEQVIG